MFDSFKLTVYCVIIVFILYVIYSFKQQINKTVPSLFQNNTHWRCQHVPGDGSCFYHSVLYLLSKEYRKGDAEIRSQMPNDLRLNLIKYVTPKIWDKKYSHIISYEKLHHNLLHAWAGNIEWCIVADYFKINIIIIRDSSNSLYWGHDSIQNDRKIIFIINKEDIHFEPLVYKHSTSPYKEQYSFQYSKNIKRLLKKYK